MEDEEKVIVKLVKQPLESERREIREKKIRRIVTIILCLVFLVAGFLGGYLYMRATSNYLLAGQHGKFDYMINLLSENWLYKDDYEDIKQTLEDNAYYGMTSFPDDPYTTYMSKEEIADFADSINMNYEGIGVRYLDNGGVATILQVFKDSPAEKAGIIAGDIIVEANGIRITVENAGDIKSLILGEEGSLVNIKVLRNGIEISFDVERGKVDSTTFCSLQDDIVVLDIYSFGEDTAKECINYLDDYTEYEKLIIDLRDNGGGYQSSVAEVAGLFIGSKEVYMIEEDNTGTVVEDKTVSARYYDNFKDIVVLTNENTASAAEVLTICLKEKHPHAISVGTTTFGKGVVQSTLMFKDSSAIKLTTSKWMSPNGVWINGVGIKPDIEVFQDDVLYATSKQMKEDDVYEFDQVDSVIKMSQLALKYLGYESNRTDGYFDEQLVNTIIKYQSDNDLEVNGKIDYATFYSLIGKVSYENATNPLKDNQLQKALEALRD